MKGERFKFLEGTPSYAFKVTNKVNSVAHESAISTFNDEEVLQNAQDFVNRTLNDGTVQEAAGNSPFSFFG